MEITNINFFNNNSILATSPLMFNVNKSINPFIDITIEHSLLTLRISFYELRKKDIFINYINNFLILKISYSKKNSDEVLNLKRIFYYKNLDFDNYKAIQLESVLFVKIPFYPLNK